MEDSVDVKSLRARFNSQGRTSDTSSRDSGSPKSPRPGFGRLVAPGIENELAQKIAFVSSHRPYQGLPRSLKQEPVGASSPAFPQPPAVPGVRAPVPSSDTNKIKQTGAMLQNMMLRHQRPPVPTVSPARSPVLGPSPITTPILLRHQPRQKSSGEVTPLRRPLPLEGPVPSKPKRPPNVNLELFRRARRESTQSYQRCPTDVRVPIPAVISPPKPPQRSNKPTRLPRQIASVDNLDDQETYDDIGGFEKNESCSDHNSQSLDADDDDEDMDDVYECIDDEQLEPKQPVPENNYKKDSKRQQELEKKEQLERQRKQAELKKNFQIQGEVNVLHTAKVRQDWRGEGKLDLSVQQGESVEILRVENNPRGKWLARSLSGQYGYISNSCVDIDYEAVKKYKIPLLRKMETFDLPPPPPDPPMMLNTDANNRDSFFQEDDDYDDVQPFPEDFPPPPPEISIDPKEEQEIKKKFKLDGDIRVLHCMMVDPNAVIKKPGAKDLQVTQGEVVHVIRDSNNKKCLCRNTFGKYGYVSKSLLLPMEGDIYDDVDYHNASDVYDNDNMN